MSVGVAGGYRFLGEGRYSPEQVAIWLPTVWGWAPWLSVEPSPKRCLRGAGKCSHDCDEDQWAEGCTVDGTHKTCRHVHGGHDQCGKCACVSPKSRRSNDNRESDAHAIVMDLKRAWALAPRTSEVNWSMFMRHNWGFDQPRIAREQLVSQQMVSLRLRAGHMALADYLNGVHQ